jgi:hypothetical protein
MAAMFLIPIFLTFITKFIFTSTYNKITSQSFLNRKFTMRAFFSIHFNPRFTTFLFFSQQVPI